MGETAIVIGVPEAEPLVGDLYRRHTRSGAEGMPPHVTLLIPFADSESLPMDDVAAVLRAREPFEFELTEPRRFETSANVVLWLAPEPALRFVALTEALVAAFPQYLPYGGGFAEIVPHLTVAVSSDTDLLDAIERRVAAALPLAATARAATIVHRSGGRWLPHSTIPLGDG